MKVILKSSGGIIGVPRTEGTADFSNDLYSELKGLIAKNAFSSLKKKGNDMLQLALEVYNGENRGAECTVNFCESTATQEALSFVNKVRKLF